MGRATQGVRLIRLDDKDKIADVTVVAKAEVEEFVENGGEVNLEGGTEQAAEPTAE